MVNVHTFIFWLEKLPKNYVWIVEIFIVLFSTLIISIIEQLIYKQVIPHFRKTHKLWDDALVHALHHPLHFLIGLLGLTYIGDIAKNAGKHWAILGAINAVRHIGLTLFVVWVLIRFAKQLAQRLVDPHYRQKPFDKTSVDALNKIIILILCIIAALIILQELGIPISGVIAFGGGGAIMVGLAAKDVLANFLGGLMIYLDRPFSVGDWIRSPDREIEGTVEHIGWRLTRISTFDKRPLYIPNAIFSNVALENPSRMTNRRIRTVFGVRYCDAVKVSKMVADIEDMLMNHPEIDARQTTFVKLTEFDASSLNILVYCFTKTTQWVKFQAIQEDIFLKIINIVYNKHQAQMAFPTRTLDIPEEVTVRFKKTYDLHNSRRNE